MIETIRRRRKGLEAHLDERPSRHGGEGEAGIR